MKKQNVFLVAIILLASLMVMAGCSSTSTVSKFGDVLYEVESTPIDSSRFDILGPVTVIGKADSGASYFDIFKEAKSLYSNVDEVINIHIDYQIATTTSGKNSSSTSATVMTGLAIKYRR